MRNNDRVQFETPPFQGVPGLRAGYFRLLYRFGMWLREVNDRTAMYIAARDRQERWDQENASPIANMLVGVLVWVLICITASAVWSSTMATSTTSGDVQPEEGSHKKIQPA